MISKLNFASTSLVFMADNQKLQVAMLPWLAFGHMIPYLEVAKRIAGKGHQITFICTPRNIDCLPKLPSQVSPLVKFVKLPLPAVDNLPACAEATGDLPTEKIPYLKKAYDGLQEAVTRVLEASKPDWIIYDFAPYWIPSIVAKLCISRAFFSIFCASSHCFGASSSLGLLKGEDPRTEPQHFTVPPKWVPFPTNVVCRPHEAKRLLDHYHVNNSGIFDTFRVGSAKDGCEVFALRSCIELEPQWLDLIGKLYQKPVLQLGLILPTAPASEDRVDETWLTISNWLDRQAKGSVTYVAFGSEAALNQEQITELAHGLELSGLSFIWVLRHGTTATGSVELPYGFEERTKGRGAVWTSWVPQLKILANESISGFLTHCGWSSVIEGLHFGRVLIMLPIAIDQGLIARFFEEKQVGVEIPRNEEDGSITRYYVAECLRLVLVDKEGEIYRQKAKEMMALFGNKELQEKYIDNFVEHLIGHRPRRKDNVD